MELGGIVDKLAEARRGLIVIALWLGVASVLGYALAPRLLTHLTADPRHVIHLVYLSPAEAFVAQVKLALCLGFLGTVPVILIQVWRFVRPALGRGAGRMALWLIPAATLLFFGGGAFGYLAVIPMALRFLLGFGSAGLEPLISVSNYVSFIIGVVLPLGILFEMPIVVLCLARLGILDPRAMSRNRKYAILAIFILAAIFSSPDVFSQTLMAVPMLVLYEASYWVARLFFRPRPKAVWSVADGAN